MKAAFLRYKVMAYVTGVVLATAFIWLVIGRVFLDYGNPDVRPSAYGYLWIAHGWLYFLYLITGVDLAFRVRYSLPRTLAILLAGTIPFMSFVAEHYVHKDIQARGLLAEQA
jgi:integral membrane protein